MGFNMNVEDVLVVLSFNAEQASSLSMVLDTPVLRFSTSWRKGIYVTVGSQHLFVKDKEIYPSNLAREEATRMSKKKRCPIFRESSSHPGKMAVTVGSEHFLIHSPYARTH